MKNDIVYYEHILECISKIQQYTKGLEHNEFIKNDMIQDAVIRNLEIIGEAANKISKQSKEENNTIPWKQIIGMRNRLIHDYFGVDSGAVWQTLIDDLPFLKEKIIKIVDRAD
ncbi:MAG: DUF86 domain-containing protein [Ignavibacteria bacterium]|nr:DUF86 domain-containing protein [Ignavibacteria bacterium]